MTNVRPDPAQRRTSEGQPPPWSHAPPHRAWPSPARPLWCQHSWCLLTPLWQFVPAPVSCPRVSATPDVTNGTVSWLHWWCWWLQHRCLSHVMTMSVSRHHPSLTSISWSRHYLWIAHLAIRQNTNEPSVLFLFKDDQSCKTIFYLDNQAILCQCGHRGHSSGARCGHNQDTLGVNICILISSLLPRYHQDQGGRHHKGNNENVNLKKRLFLS